MIVELPVDIQSSVLDIYKTDLRQRYESSCHYILDMIRASCGFKADVLIHYMANMVQNPFTKPHFAIVLTGEFAHVISYLLCKVAGEYVAGDCRLLGRFNGGLKEKKLVVIESTFTDSMLGKVKELLKSPTVIIEERRRDAEQIPSYHRVVMISPAPIADRARRFFTVHCDRVDGFETDVAYNFAFESLMDHLEKR